jgi:hypothetical protein
VGLSELVRSLGQHGMALTRLLNNNLQKFLLTVSGKNIDTSELVASPNVDGRVLGIADLFGFDRSNVSQYCPMSILSFFLKKTIISYTHCTYLSFCSSPTPWNRSVPIFVRKQYNIFTRHIFSKVSKDSVGKTF